MKIFADKELAQTRYNICKSCDKFTNTKQCEECGCFMIAKVKINKSTCPIGKW